MVILLSAKPIMLSAMLATMILSGCSDSSNGDSAPPTGTSLETTVVDSGPFKIKDCKAIITTTLNPNGNSVPHLWVYTTFENSSTKSAKAAIISYSSFTAFGKAMSSDETHFAHFNYTLAGDIGANGDEEHGSTTFDDTFPDVAKIHCEMSRVKFTDGSTWTNPDFRAD